MPKSDKLREWFWAMLRKASKENIVVDLTNLYDHFLISTGECKAKLTASRLPYFNDYFWRGAADDIINQLQQEYAQNDLSANGSKDVLMRRLSDTIRPMKGDFIVVHLQHSCNHCRELMVSGNRWVCTGCSKFQLCDKCYGVEQKLEDGYKHPTNSKDKHVFHPVEVRGVAQDTKDKDEIIESEFFDTRESFLSLCRRDDYQFDTLRREKYSSMMVLYHLHNPTSVAFLTACNMCQQDITAGQGWSCGICPYDLKYMLDLLVHTSQCRYPQCHYRSCFKVKGVFRHGNQCKRRASGGCIQCKKMWYLLQIHAQNCKTKSECHVPRCRDLKAHLKKLQEQSDTRRRAAVMDMIRQQATEGVLDKMGHLSVAVEAPMVDTMTEEDYYAEDVVDKMGHFSITEAALDTVDEQQHSLPVPEVVLDSMDEHQSVDDEWICI